VTARGTAGGAAGGAAGGTGAVVDAHHHLWRIDRGYAWLDEPDLAPIRRDFTVADLREAIATAGVGRTVLVEAARCDAAETTEFLAVADATGEIAGVVGWVDLVEPDLAETVAAHRAGPGGRWLVGARDQVQGQPDPTTSPAPTSTGAWRRSPRPGSPSTSSSGPTSSRRRRSPPAPSRS